MTLPHFDGRAFLAPMARISDAALRLMAREYGAGLVVTELTSINAIVQREKILAKEQKAIDEFIVFSEKERPVSVQLFGCDIPLLKKATEIVSPYFDIIDYNMGCPAPHITSQMAGAALLQKPELTRKIFTTMVEATDRPVTLKMRAGVTEENRGLFKEVAAIAQECGVQMVTLHARTVRQGYSGVANWDEIKELKQLMSVPVVGNGDITCAEDAKKMIDHTGCDYVMIGRAARGNPFIFSQINEYLKTGTYTPVHMREHLEAVFTYLEYAQHFKVPFARMRAQAMNFTRGMEGGAPLRDTIGKVQTLAELKKVISAAL